MQMNCLIIDDEPIAREGLCEYAERIAFLQVVGTCHSAMEASARMREHQVDLMFLDIQMPEMNGLEFARSLQTRPLLVFTTAFRNFGPEGFDLDAVDYLVKPIAFERFLRAANKARERHEQGQAVLGDVRDNYVFVKIDGKFVKIHFAEILYFESDRDYVYIHTPGKRYMALLSLKNIEPSLPAQFVKTHRSFIVNRDHIAAIDGNSVKIGDRQLPISRGLHDEVYRRLMDGRVWRR